MKWLRAGYRLFVDDPKVVVGVAGALVAGRLLVNLGMRTMAGGLVFFVTVAVVWYSVRTD